MVVVVMVQWTTKMAGWDPKFRFECYHCYAFCSVVSKASEHQPVSLAGTSQKLL